MKKLTKTQKAKNKKIYEKIRQGYDEVKAKNPLVSYKQFKNRVNAYLEADKSLNLKAAIRKVQNTETFTSAAERSRNNLLDALKEDHPNEYKQIRNLSRNDKGAYKKIELEWIKHAGKGGYSFVGSKGQRYFIDMTNSPKAVSVYAI